MIRSLCYLRRGLLGIAFAGSLGFGATQAFASPEQAERAGSCYRSGYAYLPFECPECPSGSGYCDGYNTECVCYEW